MGTCPFPNTIPKSTNRLVCLKTSVDRKDWAFPPARDQLTGSGPVRYWYMNRVSSPTPSGCSPHRLVRSIKSWQQPGTTCCTSCIAWRLSPVLCVCDHLASSFLVYRSVLLSRLIHTPIQRPCWTLQTNTSLFKMAITFQSNTSTDGWARWPQQSQQPHANPDQYPFLETGMMSFGCQSGSPTTPIQRNNFAQPFITNAFRHHQLSPPASPPYQGPVAYNEPVPLTPQTLPDSSSSFRAQPRPEPLTQPRRRDRWEVMTPVERSRSPSVTVEERRPSPDSSSASSPTSTTSKEITPNVRVGGAPVYETRTAVDDLMKVLQTRVKTAKLTEKSRKEQQQQANGSSEEGQKDSQQGAAAAGKARKKRFACDIPGCTKTFAQRNNLETHRRAHTGESPYVSSLGRRWETSIVLIGL